jgi:hypothetical protein
MKAGDGTQKADSSVIALQEVGCMLLTSVSNLDPLMEYIKNMIFFLG